MAQTTYDNWPDIGPDEKIVPGDAATRLALRELAIQRFATGLNGRPPSRFELAGHGRSLLDEPALDRRFLGYAVLCASNALWLRSFESVPFANRLLVLPQCLRHAPQCQAAVDASGVQCVQCGACAIGRLRQRALALGYDVMVAEGTPSVVERILNGRARALLGLACMDSLEKVSLRFDRLSIPHVALPLLCDGCVDTHFDEDEIFRFLGAHSDRTITPPSTMLPLMKAAVRLFNPPAFDRLMNGALKPPRPVAAGAAFGFTESAAIDWLVHGGKRLRPFIVLAGYAVGHHGRAVFDGGGAIEPNDFPDGVCRLALGIEALHKASLAHDDIEDGDPYRYGRETLHRRHGIAQALNIGDYLVGLGYRLVASSAGDLGHDTASAIVTQLAKAHQALCRGQGAELFMGDGSTAEPPPIDILSMYALKTSPAFEAALFAGLRAAGAEHVPAAETLRRFCLYLGEGYQVLNDLDDWENDVRNKKVAGGDAMSGRPTLLRAFAIEAGYGERLRAAASGGGNEAEAVGGVSAIYTESGAFEKAHAMLGKLRERALALSADVPSPEIRYLFENLVRILL